MMGPHLYTLLSSLGQGLHRTVTRVATVLRRYPLLAIAFFTLALLACAPAAWARVGGGGGYSGGSSGGGGGGGGSSDMDGLFFLIWLCIEYPYIGIPVAIGAVIYSVFFKRRGGSGSTYRSDHHHPAATHAPRRPPVAETARAADPNFSEPAFLDFAQLVYARVHQERTGPGLDRVAAYLSPQVLQEMKQRSVGVQAVRDVIFGSTRIDGVRLTQSNLSLVVSYETNLTEVRGGKEAQLLLRERWTFRKRAGRLSPPPDRLLAMACPSCGNPAETRPDGSCVHCDTPIGEGQMLWQVQAAALLERTGVTPPELTLGGGEEPGTHLPTVFHPDFAVQLRSFMTRHPEFSMEGFKRRVSEVFLALQRSWDADRWQDARPYETDHLYQTHRYWMERYRLHRLRNRLDKIQILLVTPVKFNTDAYYEAITVRLKARMLDWTEDRDGKVVGGSRNRERTFTEYWTFIRTAGAFKSNEHAPDHCPSCGAPLDKVSQTGICGYCDAKITSGAHDWVLSSIEQDDSYRG